MADIVNNIEVGGKHYKKDIEPIEYIERNGLSFSEGNIVKYITRHKDKNKDEDIKKIIHYALFILKYQYNYNDDDICQIFNGITN